MILLLSRGEGEREREEAGGGGGMRNSIRCCISCILPCGALDVIRIVHCNGRVEEISGSIKAIDIMKAHPKHVLKKPSSSSLCSTQEQGSGNGGVVPKIVVVPPDADLQRGKIYFLMPLPSPPPSKRKQKKKKEMNHNSNSNSSDNISVAKFSDRYLSEILSEKVSSESDHQRDRRRGRVAVWRPHLESISESPPNHLL